METGELHYVIRDIFAMLDEGDRHLLGAFNLNPSQYHALLLLDADDGRRLSDLSIQLRVDKSTTSRIVDRLEQHGLVRRVADLDDRRAQRVMLTPTGSQLREKAQQVFNQSVDCRLGLLSTDEQHILGQLLVKLRAQLQPQL